MDSLFRTSLLPAHLCQLVKLTTRRAKLVVVQVFQHHDTSTVTAATGQQSPFVVPLAVQRTAHPRAAQRDARCITPPPRIARCADDVLPDVPLVRVALRSSVLPVTSWTQQIRLGKERSSRVEPLVQPCRALPCCYRDGFNQVTLYRVPCECALHVYIGTYAPRFILVLSLYNLLNTLLKYLGTHSVPILDPRVDSQILGTLYVGFATSGTSKVTKWVRQAYLFLFLNKIFLFALLYYTRNLLRR